MLIVEEYTVGLGGGTHSPTALLVLTHNHPQQQQHIYIVLSKAEFTEFRVMFECQVLFSLKGIIFHTIRGKKKNFSSALPIKRFTLKS